MTKLKKFTNILKDQLAYMMFFSASFVLLGYLIPNVYFQYLDTKIYYSFKSPLMVDQREYKSCDPITMYINRMSLIEGKGVAVRNLLLIKNDQEIRIDSQSTDVILQRGDGTMASRWKLPCNLEVGSYYYRGSLTYKINNIEKQANFYTKQFLIIE